MQCSGDNSSVYTYTYFFNFFSNQIFLKSNCCGVQRHKSTNCVTGKYLYCCVVYKMLYFPEMETKT